MREPRKNVRGRGGRSKSRKVLRLAIIAMMFAPVLTCCGTTEKIADGYRFPDLGEERREVTEKGVTAYGKDGKAVFVFDAESDTVTIPLWYWQKILRYGIDSGGISVD